MLIDYQTLVDSLVRDDANDIALTERDSAITLAISRYSKDRPRDVVEDLTAPGGQSLSLPIAWESDFSILQTLEYPLGNFPPNHLNIGSFGIYNYPAGPQLMVVESLPANASIRASFTIRHELSDIIDTISIGDREAIANYAAAILCDQLASLYSGDTDSTIQADSVDQASKARDFAIRAKTLRKRYYDELGIDPKRNVAAGAVVDIDMSDSRGRDRLMHPGRYR